MIDTEIISMELSGGSPTLGDLRLHKPTLAGSFGQIRCFMEGVPAGEKCDFAGADSFFDIFTEISLREDAWGGGDLHFQGSVQGPRLAGSSHFSNDVVTLYDENDQEVAQVSGLSLFLDRSQEPVPLPEEQIKIIVMDLLARVRDNSRSLPRPLLDELILKFDTMAELEQVAQQYKGLVINELRILAKRGDDQLQRDLRPAFDAVRRLLEIEKSADFREPESGHLVNVIEVPCVVCWNHVEGIPCLPAFCGSGPARSSTSAPSLVTPIGPHTRLWASLTPSSTATSPRPGPPAPRTER